MRDEIILENKSLIYKVIKDLHCRIRDDEEEDEYFFIGLMGLIKAIDKYDKTRSSKSTFYYTCIKNEITSYFGVRTHKKRNNGLREISLNTIINEETELIDLIPDNKRFEEDVMTKDEVKYLLSKLKDRRYKQLLIEYYGINTKPLNMSQLADKYGLKRQSVHKSIHRTLDKLRKIYKENK